MDSGMTSVTGSLLVVDDDEANRDILSRRLTRNGHDVSVAEDGTRAIGLVRERPFDLVLLDVVMPGLSGLDVLQELRQTHPATELPVIMVTAKNESGDIVEALRLGANDYVSKPLDFPVVLARIQAQLSLKRAVEDVFRLERSLAERNRDLEGANGRLAEANRRMGRDLRGGQDPEFVPPARRARAGGRPVRLALPALRRAGRRRAQRLRPRRPTCRPLCLRRQRSRRGVGPALGLAEPGPLAPVRALIGAPPER